MNPSRGYAIQRWSKPSIATVCSMLVLQLILVIAPFISSASAVDKLTTLFIYIVLAMMWNALAGYGGLVSVGQQAFFGLGAYAAVRLSNQGISVYPALLIGAILVGVVSIPISTVMLRLREGEFAIGMWVVAELIHLCVNLDPLIQGETGTSLIALNVYRASERRDMTYWAALMVMVVFIWVMFFILRGGIGFAAQAIRDNEGAASSVGVRVNATKRMVFVLSAFGCACAGALWVATTISFQPKTYFSVQWSAYMIFMVLVGGIGSFEGPILGAVLFFIVEATFGQSGVWYLIGLGGVALAFALVLPRGLWGTIESQTGIRLLPVGYFIRPSND